MRSERLSLALEAGAIELPAEGRILILRPRAGDDLSALPVDRLDVVTGFRPDFDALRAQGLAVSAEIPGDGYAAALVCLPRARDLARALLAEASARVAPGGMVIVDGQKTDGVESVHKELRQIGAAPGGALSKAHGKIFAFAAGADLSGWASRDTLVEGGFTTRPGVFSADGPDRGSMLLAAALPEKLPMHVADLGAGWGYLSRAVLERPGVQTLHLVEAEALALDCARLNVTDPRAQFHWADATTWTHKGPTFGAVVCNPPFHTGREADPSLGLAFIRAAAGMLSTSGTLWLVANRHLPYDQLLNLLFKEVEDVGGDRGFRVIRAARPLKARP